MKVRRARTPGLRSDRQRTRWKLRKASRSDLEILLDHRHRMWVELGKRTPRQMMIHDRLYRRWVLPRLRSGELVAWIVEGPSRRILASGGIWFRPEQPHPGFPQVTVPYLLSMYTEPEHRGRGYAGRIVREAVRLCRQRGYHRMLLHAAPLGLRLYRQAGFKRTWEMRLDLRR
jgi:GNAT superfamily N-acetyltransferase